MTPQEAQPAKSPIELVRIEKPVYGGACLTHIAGKAVFAPLTLPGEEARLRIARSKAGYATAEAIEIVSPAPERVAPRCPHFAACGGCNYQHATYDAQLAMKRAILRETLERARVVAPQEIDTLAAEPWGYRSRIRLAFDGAGHPGYRGLRSHEVITIRECPIAAPLLVEAALKLAELARELKISSRLRELALFTNESETGLLFGLTVASGTRIRFDEFAQTLRDRIPVLTGAELLIEGKRNEPARSAARWGEASLVYRAGGFDYRVDRGAFFQVNRFVLEVFLDRVAAGRKGALAWDLYAGVGLFARKLTSEFDRVIAVESAPASIHALTANLKGARGAPVRAMTLDFLRQNQSGARPDFIVVDPPRTGLGPEVCRALGEAAPAQIAYVSCDPATLARDLRALGEFGYTIESLALADLFPQTFHMETVAHLRRA